MKITSYTAKEINLIIDEPGVYKFYDNKNNLIYVGKAKNLKKRIKSYFNTKKESSLKTKKMVNQINQIECTVLNSEYEALLLENNLIKNHNPKYNILLRDDKSYPYICILNERFPRVIATRKVNKKFGQYFGPFSNLNAMNIILELIKEIFTIRTCKLNLSQSNIDKKKYKVCLEYHIKNCKGPCENLQTEEDYNLDVEQIKNLLKGNFQQVKKELKQRMLEAASALNFEDAQKFKEKIDAIEQYYSKSLIINPNISSDLDVFAITLTNLVSTIDEFSNEVLNNDKSKKTFISFIRVQNGIITFTQTIEVEKKLEESDEEILSLAIVYLRQKHNSNAKEILTNIEIKNLQIEAEINVPKIGDKRKIIELAIKNAFTAKRDSLHKENISKTEIILKTLQNDLNLKTIPKHIECFDNSNLLGTTPVAAMVCFIDGKPFKKHYRHFNIKTVEGANDFASMNEVVFRRYSKLNYSEDKKDKGFIDQENNLKIPNLIIIDGGKGQLNFAVSALKKLKIYDKTEIISIAKKLEEIYKPNDPFPIHLCKTTSSLKLIQRIRNEAHRFAITFHKQKRDTKDIKSQLTDIKGIGPKTSILLLKHFKSIENIKNSSEEELIKLVGQNKTDIIINYFKQKDN